MANYLEATAIREYQDKNTGEVRKSYTKLGMAFPFKDREGYTVRLDAMPAPQDGTYTFMLFVPKPKDNASQQGSRAGYGDVSSGAAAMPADDPEIPF